MNSNDNDGWEKSRRGDSQSGQRVAAASGVFGAVAASSCCMLPLLPFTLGVSGPWIGKLTQLAPYQPYVIGLTIGCLGYGYWLVYRSSPIGCADEHTCGSQTSKWVVRSGLIVATLLTVASIGFDLLAPLFIS